MSFEYNSPSALVLTVDLQRFLDNLRKKWPSAPSRTFNTSATLSPDFTVSVRTPGRRMASHTAAAQFTTPPQGSDAVDVAPFYKWVQEPLTKESVESHYVRLIKARLLTTCVSYTAFSAIASATDTFIRGLLHSLFVTMSALGPASSLSYRYILESPVRRHLQTNFSRVNLNKQQMIDALNCITAGTTDMDDVAAARLTQVGVRARQEVIGSEFTAIPYFPEDDCEYSSGDLEAQTQPEAEQTASTRIDAFQSLKQPLLQLNDSEFATFLEVTEATSRVTSFIRAFFLGQSAYLKASRDYHIKSLIPARGQHSASETRELTQRELRVAEAKEKYKQRVSDFDQVALEEAHVQEVETVLRAILMGQAQDETCPGLDELSRVVPVGLAQFSTVTTIAPIYGTSRLRKRCEAVVQRGYLQYMQRHRDLLTALTSAIPSLGSGDTIESAAFALYCCDDIISVLRTIGFAAAGASLHAASQVSLWERSDNKSAFQPDQRRFPPQIQHQRSKQASVQPRAPQFSASQRMYYDQIRHMAQQRGYNFLAQTEDQVLATMLSDITSRSMNRNNISDLHIQLAEVAEIIQSRSTPARSQQMQRQQMSMTPRMSQPTNPQNPGFVPPQMSLPQFQQNMLMPGNMKMAMPPLGRGHQMQMPQLPGMMPVPQQGNGQQSAMPQFVPMMPNWGTAVQGELPGMSQYPSQMSNPPQMPSGPGVSMPQNIQPPQNPGSSGPVVTGWPPVMPQQFRPQ